MTQLMQLVIGANDTAGYPGAFVTIAGAALNHFAKGVVERDPVGRTLMKALHAAAEMELLWPKYRPGRATTRGSGRRENQGKIPR